MSRKEVNRRKKAKIVKLLMPIMRIKIMIVMMKSFKRDNQINTKTPQKKLTKRMIV